MRYESYVVQQTVVSDSVVEYDRQMNEVLNNAPGATIIDRMDNGRYCSIVRYTKTVSIPETVEEEYYLEGKRFYCKDCKYYQPPTDGRRRSGTCECGTSVHIDASACEYFYMALRRGEDIFKNKTMLEDKEKGGKK